MITIKGVSTLSRCAAFEIQSDSYYYFSSEYTIILNGEEYGDKFNTNVFVLYGLTPSTGYTAEVLSDGEIIGKVTFETAAETCLINPVDFGAKGDGSTDDTLSLQNAIATCPMGGTVYLSKGTYYTYPLFLHSNMTLYMEKGAKLVGGTQRQRYPILSGKENSNGRIFGTWEGELADCYSSLVTALYGENINICGEGTIDGNASESDWWVDPKTLRTAWRPRTIFLNHCRNVNLMGFTVCNSPSWTVHPFYCNGFNVIGVTIKNPPDSPNTDGCNPESCSNVLLLGNHISVGDDCIAIKSGKYSMVEKYLQPSYNITVRNCLLERGHGAVVVGSEASSGLKDLSISQSIWRDTDRGLRVKTRRGRGNTCLIDEITCENILMERVLTPFVINMFYNCDIDGHTEYVRTKASLPVDEMTPTVGKMLCKNIVCNDCHYAGAYFYGLPENPIQSVVFQNVAFSFDLNASPGMPALLDDIEPMARKGLFAENITYLELSDVSFENHDGDPCEINNIANCVINPKP